MKKFPKLWFRPGRGVWYVTLKGRQINLGSDEEAAFAKCSQLLARPELQEVASDSLPVLIDTFLDWVQKNRAPDTYGWYQYRLERFAKKFPKLQASEVRPHHVHAWVDGYKFSVGTRRNYMRTIKTCLAWAVREGHLEKNPLAYLALPAGGRREDYVTEAEFKTLLAAVPSEEFRDLLNVSWETGCRPQESLRVEARHVDLAHRRWVFSPSESKSKKTARVVYLSDKAFAITEKLVDRWPEGKLFRNSTGVPWTTDAVKCRFAYLKTKLKRGYSLYSLRHGFATRNLMKGMDSITVATLMGHKDPSLLARTYQHVAQNPSHMLEQAKKAAG